MIVYFSGTGNSRHCAEFLAKRLQDDVIDAAGYIKHRTAADLITGKPWIFVSPTYAWRIPRVFAEFVRTGSFHGHQDAYFVMTCGNDIGNAGKYNRALCSKVGLNYCGVMPVVMPENYIAMFDVPDERQAAEIIAAAEPVLQKAASLIQQKMDFPEQNLSVSDRMKSSIVNSIFYPVFVHAKAFYVKDHCIGCGKCAERCVMNNISMINGHPSWEGRCTHCMACICGCPVEAVEYGKKSRGKPRYWCK